MSRSMSVFLLVAIMSCAVEPRFSRAESITKEVAPRERPSAVASRDRHCGPAYPYSGSNVYFTGLTELRTSEPLGALFGYHVQRPCWP